MSREFFFTLGLTESEHSFVEEMIREKCAELGLTLVYYRKFKTGHVPMQREVKITGERLSEFKQYLSDERIIIGNYHAKEKELQSRYKSGRITPEQYFEELRKL